MLMRNRALTVICGITLCALVSCSDYNKVLKTSDYGLKYEVAKQSYAEGEYNRASVLLREVIAMLKGTEDGEASLFLLGMSYFKAEDYEAAAEVFKKYYETYPRGIYAEEARFHIGLSLYHNVPEPKLDQTATYEALTEFQNFLEEHPNSSYREEVQRLIFDLQDVLVEKEYLNAKMYYDLGTYFGNCTNGGNNFQACIVTAQNAISDYPYSSRRENFAILILKAKFELAAQSVLDKQEERFHNAIDEYYGFCNEYPESTFMPQAKELYEKAKRYVKN